MILEVKDLQNAAVKVLSALDSDSNLKGDSNVSAYLELVTVGRELLLNITNSEYYVRIKLPINEEVEFRAVVDAKLFCSLISKITTKDIELQTVSTYLLIKGNGNYKLPLIFKGNDLLELPEIDLGEVTNELTISTDVLFSILNYNTKEVNKAEVRIPVQRLYYIDQEGCITFTTGACVNNFKLDQPVRLLLNQKLVKLFKLFKEGDVAVHLGQTADSRGVVTTKIKLELDNVTVTAFTSTTNEYLDRVPVRAIRNQVTSNCPYQVVINRVELLQALTRLLLFNTMSVINKNCGTLSFTQDTMTIYDYRKENSESLKYVSSEIDSEYSTLIDIEDLKSVLEGCSEDVLTLNFGNKRCVVVSRTDVSNVIPELCEE